ncbi:hypothetical protein Ciccas_010618, partial [Cichlidogyrus casuarinus]
KEISLSVCIESHCIEAAATSIRTYNASADPCEDFHKYACGKYELNQQMPEKLNEISPIPILQLKIRDEFLIPLLTKTEFDSVEECAELITKANENFYFKPYLNAKFAKWANLDAEREDLRKLTGNIKQEAREFFQGATWLDDPTREKAIEKLDRMEIDVAGPNDMENGHKLVLKFQKDKGLLFGDPKKSHYENMVKISTFDKRWDFLYLTIDEKEEYRRTMYDLTHNNYHTVNAYNSISENRIIISGGVSVPPFYFKPGVELFSYARLGAVIGHEIMHGFDSDGSAKNAEGQVFDWWTTETRQNYNKTQTCFKNQMYKFEYRGLKGDGILTIGENFSDNMGFHLAFKAFRRLVDSGKMNIRISGLMDLSWQQIFFTAYAQNWCFKVSDLDALEKKHKVDVHPLLIFRIYSVISNSKEFPEAFNCSVGSPMNPIEKCHL